MHSAYVSLKYVILHSNVRNQKLSTVITIVCAVRITNDPSQS
jgi:hypothetical protein